MELVWTLGFLSLGLFDFTARVHGGWREYKTQNICVTIGIDYRACQKTRTWIHHMQFSQKKKKDSSHAHSFL